MKSFADVLGSDLNVDAAFRQIIAGEPERALSPAVGEYAILENARLKENVRILRRALNLLVLDVQDYDAWQRPCYALDEAKAALAKVTA